MLSIKKGKQKRNTLDLALVIGLTQMIKTLARLSSTRLTLAHLELIEQNERGKRKQAIRHIRMNVPARSLGIRTTVPRVRGSGLGRKLSKLFQDKKICPMCKKGKLIKKTSEKQEKTECPKCRFYLKPIKVNYRPLKEVTRYLSDLDKFQILSHWASLNDPNPIMYKTRK